MQHALSFDIVQIIELPSCFKWSIEFLMVEKEATVECDMENGLSTFFILTYPIYVGRL